MFAWSLESPSSGGNATDIVSLLSGLSSSADRVKVPGSLLTAGETYVFKLGVANFLSSSEYENFTHTVTKAADPVPELTLSSQIDLNTGEVLVSEEFSIRATAIVSLPLNSLVLFPEVLCLILLFSSALTSLQIAVTIIIIAIVYSP